MMTDPNQLGIEGGLWNHIRETIKDDIRLFLAPFVGAIQGIKQEVKRVQRRDASRKQ
ncbi:hypothetical protein GCM10027343_43280 [Noviherbaspirillum agri]